VFKTINYGKELLMATMPSTELLKLWEREEMTPEMAIGHMLQNMAKEQTTLEAFQRTLLNLRMDVDRLIAHTGLPSSTKGKQQLPKPS
jgi:hypothetical protein